MVTLLFFLSSCTSPMLPSHVTTTYCVYEYSHTMLVLRDESDTPEETQTNHNNTRTLSFTDNAIKAPAHASSLDCDNKFHRKTSEYIEPPLDESSVIEDEYDMMDGEENKDNELLQEELIEPELPEDLCEAK